MRKILRMHFLPSALATVCLAFGVVSSAPAAGGNLAVTDRPLTPDEIAIGYGEQKIPMRPSHEENRMYFPGDWDDIPVSELIDVDPRATPYPIVIEESWEKYLNPHAAFSLMEYLEDAKAGNVGALVYLARHSSSSSWDRLVDKLTRQGWCYGVLQSKQKGAFLGDGYSLFKAQPGAGLSNRAALHGYPEAMTMISFAMKDPRQCELDREWKLESALRGYDYGWTRVGFNFMKVCPGEDREPDYVKAYAAWDLACRSEALAWDISICGERNSLVKEGHVTAAQVRDAQRQAAAWQAEAADLRARNLAEQRRRREQVMPEVREAINGLIDNRLPWDEENREALQRIRAQ